MLEFALATNPGRSSQDVIRASLECFFGLLGERRQRLRLREARDAMPAEIARLLEDLRSEGAE